MRVVQVAKRLVENDWGGAETVILETSKQLVQKGHSSEVYCTLASANSASDTIQGICVRRFPYFYPYLGLRPESREALDRKGGSPLSYKLMRALQSYPDLDLIHLHTLGRLGGIGRHIARKRRIPYVVSLHGGVFDVPPEESASWSTPHRGTWDWGKPIGWWLGSRDVLRDAGAVLCVGYPESQLAKERLPDTRVVYLPNGVDPHRFKFGDGAGFRSDHGIPQDAYVLLTVGRIDSQKNQLLLVHALPHLKAICERIRIVIVGPVTNATYADEMASMAERSSLGNEVTIIPGLPGGSRELANAYHAADAFVLPSIHEPFGIVVLEAWSARLPVIASRVGGIPHFVDDGVDGLLFDPADIGTFIEAFRQVYSSRERAANLARKGYEKTVEQYTWQAITDRLIRLYCEVIDEHSLRK